MKTGGQPGGRIGAFDRWDRFWSDAMVWSLRLACYASNEHFFAAVQASLQSAVHPAITSAGILAYSMACLWFIERFFTRRHDPAYGHLDLTAEQRRYRVEGERILYSCFLFTAANCALGVLAAMAFAAPAASAKPMAFGIAGIFVSLFGVFVGIICMVGRSGTTGQRMPHLYPLGIVAFLLPALYVLLTVRSEFLAGRNAWW